MRDWLEVLWGVGLGLVIASALWSTVHPRRIKLPWEDENGE